MPGIEIREVTKQFGETIAVDRVSLEIRKGELFFLLGPSGCGKTTLLRILAGFETPDCGDVLFDGQSILSVPPHRRNTGMVFQNYALWPHMTVEKNVAYGLDERRVPAAEKAERVKEALRAVRMEEYAQRTPNQLSGGQQQRIALARALVIRPSGVLLDEPLSNLDARLRLEMREEIRRIHDETGITMVYVTHDQKESLSMADRIAVMSMGRVEQTGDPREIYRTPVSRFVADFIGEANFIEGRLVSATAGGATVKTSFGDLSARPAPAGLTAGAAVLCMVRPECLSLSQISGANKIRAQLVRRVYLGDLEEFALEAGQLRLKLVVAGTGAPDHRPGSNVDVCFKPEDTIVLPPK